MTVSSIETFNGAIAGGDSAVLTVTTSLVPTDRLVVILLKSSTTSTPTVTGLGTWSVLQSMVVTRDTYLFTASGITGGGNVTISPGTPSADYVMFVLRGSGGEQVNVFGSQIARTTTGGTTTTADISSALTGMFVCVGGNADPGAGVVLPGAGTLPLAGWTTTRTATNTDGKFIHQILSGDSTVRANITSGSGGGATIVTVGVFSEASVPSPLESTFIGWGNPIF